VNRRLTEDDYLSGLRIAIVGNSVQLTLDNERLDLFLEDVQVHIRPLNLGLTSV
jgi:hypothetical protein